MKDTSTELANELKQSVQKMEQALVKLADQKITATQLKDVFDQFNQHAGVDLKTRLLQAVHLVRALTKLAELK